MDTEAIELRIFNGGSRWLLQGFALVEIWTATRLVGTLSGRAVTLIVEHHLATAALTAAVQAELLTDAAPEPARPVRRPPQPMLAEAERAQRRARRRTRRKERMT